MKKSVTNWIAGLRAHFNLSQQQLADFLSVNRSLVALAERNKRTLPYTALQKLNLLEAVKNGSLSNAAEKQITATARVQYAIAVKTLNKRIAVCQSNIELYEKQLKLAENKFQQAKNCLQLINSLPVPAAKNEEAKKDAKWMEVMELEAMGLMKKYGHQTQALLRIKIECLKYETTIAAEKIQQIELDTNPNV